MTPNTPEFMKAVSSANEDFSNPGIKTSSPEGTQKSPGLVVATGFMAENAVKMMASPTDTAQENELMNDGRTNPAVMMSGK